jgi:hypothetical protein
VVPVGTALGLTVGTALSGAPVGLTGGAEDAGEPAEVDAGGAAGESELGLPGTIEVVTVAPADELPSGLATGALGLG